MRVISGKVRGLKLTTPECDTTRPTADRIKESIFNMLASDLGDSCFLDIFGGTGAIGIEALSRGAREAYFIENSSKSVKILKSNVKATRLTGAVVLEMDFKLALHSLGKEQKKFDIIFMDPPYHKGFVSEVLELIKEHKLLNPEGFIVIEQSEKDPDDFQGFSIFKEKKYGVTKIYFLHENE